MRNDRFVTAPTVRVVLAVIMAVTLAVTAGAEEPAFPRSPHVHPSPEPFTLNGYDAVQAVWMIRRVGLLLHETPGGTAEIIPIRETADVRAVHVGTDPDAPGPQHQERYDIVINDEPLDWDNTFIRYGGRMINLRALFTYRNQIPPDGLRYRLDR